MSGAKSAGILVQRCPHSSRHPRAFEQTKERALGRGFLAGIFWGGIVGFAMLAVSSFVLERQELSLPRPEAVPVEVPAGTEFDQARPETDPVVPEAETRPESEQVGGVTAPADAVETPPAFDTSSLEVPQPTVDAPNELGETPEIAEEVDINVTGPSAGDSDNAPEAEEDNAANDTQNVCHPQTKASRRISIGHVVLPYTYTLIGLVNFPIRSARTSRSPSFRRIWRRFG